MTLAFHMLCTRLLGLFTLSLTEMDPPAAPRSRSSSGASSRGGCKDCARKKDPWLNHKCLRHGPCMDSELHLWDPDRCEVCSDLLAQSASKDKEKKKEARGVLKEILRGAEAVAVRRDLKGFVSAKTFGERFQPWMGALHAPRVIRDAPPTNAAESSGASQATTPVPTTTKRPSPTKSLPARGVSSDERAKPPASAPCGASSSGQLSLQGPDLDALIKAILESRQGSGTAEPRRSRSRERRSRSRTPESSSSSSSSVRSASSVSSLETGPSRSPSPPRSPGMYDLFGSDDEPEKELDDQPAAQVEEEDPNAARVGLAYYWLPHDASLGDNGLSLGSLPPVPSSNVHKALLEGRQAVAFLDPTLYPAIEYVCRLKRAGDKKDWCPSQKEYQRMMRQTVSFLEKHVPSWETVDPQSAEGPVRVKESPRWEAFALTKLQPKSYGDEATRPPSSPIVPITSAGPRLQSLMNFLEAPPLSPTSHKLHRGYGDRRTTREPPKPDRDTDYEYRRAARSTLGVAMAWEYIKELADCPDVDASTRIRAIRAVTDTFQRDVTSCVDYGVTRAVHHRRNLIHMSTQDMPQEDIKVALRELFLSEGTSLFHESAEAKVEQSLLRPEGRQLEPLREFDSRKPRRVSNAVKRDLFQASNRRPSPSHVAPQRKRTRPNPPLAPPRRSEKEGAKGKKKSPHTKSSKTHSTTQKFPARGPSASTKR